MEELVEYYTALKSIVDDFQEVAQAAANGLLTRVLPLLYNLVGITSGGGDDVDKKTAWWRR